MPYVKKTLDIALGASKIQVQTRIYSLEALFEKYGFEELK
jgi:hypothetical protein